MTRDIESVSFAARYDALLSEPRMQRLYGTSGYFNVGYWSTGVSNLIDACGRLVDEVAAPLPADTAVIVDVGCGFGAGTRRLCDRFPRALVIAANISPFQLASARARGVAASVAMDAAMMALRAGCADAVVAIESALHFNTRATFFTEAYRVLRPGGMLVTADMLFRDPDAIGAWLVPEDNRITTTEEYSTVLSAAGFTGASVRDITAVSWRPYCVAMREVFEGHLDSLRVIEQSLACYVLAVARRPTK